MPEAMQSLYEQCRRDGVHAVARRLGVTARRLVVALYHAGVGGAAGCPSRHEIAERCREVQRSWSDARRNSRWDATRKRAAG
jgi:hypothetical protein